MDIAANTGMRLDPQLAASHKTLSVCILLLPDGHCGSSEAVLPPGGGCSEQFSGPLGCNVWVWGIPGFLLGCQTLGHVMPLKLAELAELCVGTKSSSGRNGCMCRCRNNVQLLARPHMCQIYTIQCTNWLFWVLVMPVIMLTLIKHTPMTGWRHASSTVFGGSDGMSAWAPPTIKYPADLQQGLLAAPSTRKIHGSRSREWNPLFAAHPTAPKSLEKWPEKVGRGENRHREWDNLRVFLMVNH